MVKTLRIISFNYQNKIKLKSNIEQSVENKICNLS